MRVRDLNVSSSRYASLRWTNDNRLFLRCVQRDLLGGVRPSGFRGHDDLDGCVATCGLGAVFQVLSHGQCGERGQMNQARYSDSPSEHGALVGSDSCVGIESHVTIIADQVVLAN